MGGDEADAIVFEPESCGLILLVLCQGYTKRF
jgi:hypothetical protein